MAEKHCDALAAQVQALREALEMARTLVIRHHNAAVVQKAGCFCPVCSPDGTDQPYDQCFNALALTPATALKGWVRREVLEQLLQEHIQTASCEAWSPAVAAARKELEQ